MKKKIFLTFILIALSIGGYIYYRVTKPRPSLTNTTPAVSITAPELYRLYQTSETTADSRFLDKIIEVTGIVSDVHEADSSLSVELKGGEIGGINCGIAGGNKDKSPKEGSTITVKGKCSGFLMDVTLTDCVIEDKQN